MEITALHLFADEEGSCPFSADLFNKQDDDPIIEDGIITGVGGSGKLVYLGDLMDRYPNEIRLMLQMIEIHDSKSDQITLIAGNRDVNKMRLKDELKIKGIDDIVSSLKDKAGLVELANKLTNENIIFTDYDDTRFKFWNSNTPALKNNKSEDPETRLAACVSSLMGVNRPNLALHVKIAEASSLGFNTEKLMSDSAKAIFVCMLYTILAGAYPKPIHSTDEDFKKLFGLYGRYLERCKIMSLETVNGANVLVAHGGVPDIISNPIGFDMHSFVSNTESTNKKKCVTIASNAKEVIDAINDDFTNHVQHYFKYPTDPKNIALLNYYVGLSGPLQDNDLHGPNGDFTNKLSPIVYRNLLNVQNHKNMYVGGDGNINYDDPILSNLTDKTKTLVNFVVFGHTPQGNAPTVWAGKETVFAAIDVSNSNDDKTANYSTFALMTIRSAKDMIVRGQYVDAKNGSKIKQYNNSIFDYKLYTTKQLDMKDYNFRYLDSNNRQVYTITNIGLYKDPFKFGDILDYDTMKTYFEKKKNNTVSGGGKALSGRIWTGIAQGVAVTLACAIAGSFRIPN